MKIDRPRGEQDRIDACVTALAETFDRAVTEGMLTGYQLGLSGVPVAQVEQATVQAMKSCKFMPRPAELRELVGELNASDRALAAWACVQQASAVGSYSHVDFDDGLINATIRAMGGWPALLARPTDDFDKWARKEFLETYSALMRSGVSAEACRALPGLSESGLVVSISGKVHEVQPRAHRIATGLAPVAPTVVHQIAATRRANGVPALELKKP